MSATYLIIIIASFKFMFQKFDQILFLTTAKLLERNQVSCSSTRSHLAHKK